MSSEKVQRILATIAANYLKRWMEGGVYDRAFDTPGGQKLRELSPSARYAIEAALYVASATLVTHSKNDSVIAETLKDLGSDIAPEVAKRLINQFEHSARPEDRPFEGLSQRDLRTVRNWAKEATVDQKRELIDQMKRHALDDLVERARTEPPGGQASSALEKGTETLRAWRAALGDLKQEKQSTKD